MKLEKIMADLEKKHPGEVEYLQAVHEVLESIEEIYNENPQFEAAGIIERIVEPDRILTFKVPWVDDNGKVHVNLGYRVQFNNAMALTKVVYVSTQVLNLSI
jgi:glutamate dehydrogenase (NADP+)